MYRRVVSSLHERWNGVLLMSKGYKRFFRRARICEDQDYGRSVGSHAPLNEVLDSVAFYKLGCRQNNKTETVDHSLFWDRLSFFSHRRCFFVPRCHRSVLSCHRCSLFSFFHVSYNVVRKPKMLKRLSEVYNRQKC